MRGGGGRPEELAREIESLDNMYRITGRLQNIEEEKNNRRRWKQSGKRGKVET